MLGAPETVQTADSKGSSDSVRTDNVEDTASVAGSGPLSFDELEARENSVNRTKAAELQREEKAKEKLEEQTLTKSPYAVAKAKEEKKAEKKKAESPEPKEPKEAVNKDENLEDVDDSEESSEDKTSEESKADESNETEAKVKLLDVYNGKDKVQIRSDAVMKVKIDGKIEDVPMQELANNYSGRAHLERQAKEQKTEREAFQKVRDGLNTMVEEFSRLIRDEKDPRSAIEFLAEQAGADPIKTWEDFRNQGAQDFEQLASMSEEERQAKFLKDENDYYRRKHEREIERRKQEEQKKVLVTRWSKVREKNPDLTEDLMKQHYNDLAPKFSDDQITPELIGEYHQTLKRENALVSVIKDTVSGDEDQKAALIEMREVLRKVDGLTEKDIEQIVKEHYGQTAVKRLVKKIEKNEKKRKQETPVVNPMNEPLFFHQLG